MGEWSKVPSLDKSGKNFGFKPQMSHLSQQKKITLSYKKAANTKKLRKKILNSLLRGKTNKKGKISICEKKGRNAS